MKLKEWLVSNNACPDAIRWANGKSFANAWSQCTNPEWMLWALEKSGWRDDRILRLFACRCVREIWHLLTDDRSKKAVEVAELFADDKATKEELAAARDAARAAAWAVAARATAAWAAAAEAAAAEAAAAGAAARDAARAAAWAVAARDAARDAAWDAARAKQADILREMVQADQIIEQLQPS